MGRTFRSLGLACLLALTLLSLGERQTTTVLAAANGRIVFDSDRTGNRDIFAMDSDGSHVVNLTNSPTDEERAGNSPDGQKIAFARTVNDNTDIYVMNANGSGVMRLTTDPAVDHAPQWSPNGQKIAFRSDRDGNSNIYVMDADGSDQTRLTNNPADDNGPDWSPNGQKIVFSSERTGNSDVFVMDADGSNPVQLTTDPADDFGASWSPDGTRIAFRSGRNGTSEVYVMGVNGQGQTNLTNHPAFDRGPAWSPDGSKIVFYSNRDGDYEIYVMDANGSNVERLTNSPGRDFQPDWGAGEGVPPPMCYPLTRSHSGQGSDPVASPNKSTGCGTGQYVEGELITLTAAPAVDWSVAGWSGTNNDGSTAPTNTVTMPAANHAVSVVYDQAPPTCYTLTRSHIGQGSDPVASPNKSTGCGAGQYVEGELITLTAAPAVGWSVAGWSGTNNDGSTAANQYRHHARGQPCRRCCLRPDAAPLLLSDA
jgi:Tol biopolymer transport system component